MTSALLKGSSFHTVTLRIRFYHMDSRRTQILIHKEVIQSLKNIHGNTIIKGHHRAYNALLSHICSMKFMSKDL